MVRVLIVGRTPPPYLGAPMMIGALVDSKMRGIEQRHLPIRLSASDDEAGEFRWKKLGQLLLTILRIIYARIAWRSHVLYYAPELVAPRSTVLRDAAILAATRPFFSKTVLHLHAVGFRQLYEQLSGWQRWLLRRGLFYADGVIRVSSLTPNDGEELKARNEYIVPNGIDDLGVEMTHPRAKRKIDEGEPMSVLFVARLSESKGLWVLIDACARLVARGIPVRLDVMGDFESKEFADRTLAKVASLKLEGNVRFLGHLNGPAKLSAFAEADVLCHPTFNDSFGLVIVEAMACGLPVVATRWCSIPTIVDDGTTGFLVAPHDSEAVAERLACLAIDADARQRMGRAGREKFLREFTINRHLDRMRGVLLEVAEGAREEMRELSKCSPRHDKNRRPRLRTTGH